MSKIIIDGQEIDLEAAKKAAKDKAKNTKRKERRETFIGDMIDISDLCADIEIQPATDGKKITITVNGPEDVVDSLTITEENDVVVVSGGNTGNKITVQNVSLGNNLGFVGDNIVCSNIENIIGGRLNQVSSYGNFGGGMTVISGGGNVVINTGDNEAKLALKIIVPLYTEVSLTDITGYTVIGDIQGDLYLDLSGVDSSVVATSVHRLKLDASGQCKVHVNKITDSANLDISGHAKVDLLNGSLDQLIIDASGMCEVNAQTTVKNAKVNASGMCTVRVKKVTGRCRKKSSGMSHISIG